MQTQDFDNRAFWQDRYESDPGLGSGSGSRGENLLLKRHLLRTQILRLTPKSLLDVGCGDLQVVAPMVVLPQHYTGVDISQHAITLAKKLRPECSFLVGDIADLAIDPHEMVVCLDVLIHQPTQPLYERFLARLLALSRHHLLVAGYNQPPWYTSQITFYHEPLSLTLQRLGGEGTLEIVGGYRDTTLLLWSRAEAPAPLSYAQALAPPVATPAPLWRRALRRAKRILGDG